MKIKVFYPNEKGNIELTKEKLESLLNEAYNEGYRDGRYNNGYYYCTTTPLTSYTDVLYNSTRDLVSTDTLQLEKVSAIDCCVNTNGRVTPFEGNAKNAALESNPKNEIVVEYAEAANET